MTLEARIINFKLALQQKKPKSVVRHKYKLYMREYDNKEKDVLDKLRHRDLSLEYLRYMVKSGDGDGE